jgi:saccharopine dehydrogenase (NADP+, L-glutamate forming)
VDTGFLSDQEQSFLKESIPWKEATQKILDASSSSEEDLSHAVSSKTTFKDSNQKNQVLSGFKWLGVFSDSNIVPKGNPLDTLCATLQEKMQFEDGERDLVVCTTEAPKSLLKV